MTGAQLAFLSFCPMLVCGASWAATTAYRTRTYRSTFNKLFAAKLDLAVNAVLIVLSLIAAACLCLKTLTEAVSDTTLKTAAYAVILVTAVVSGIRLSRQQLVVDLEMAAERSKTRSAPVR